MRVHREVTPPITIIIQSGKSEGAAAACPGGETTAPTTATARTREAKADLLLLG